MRRVHTFRSLKNTLNQSTILYHNCILKLENSKEHSCGRLRIIRIHENDQELKDNFKIQGSILEFTFFA